MTPGNPRNAATEARKRSPFCQPPILPFAPRLDLGLARPQPGVLALVLRLTDSLRGEGLVEEPQRVLDVVGLAHPALARAALDTNLPRSDPRAEICCGKPKAIREIGCRRLRISGRSASRDRFAPLFEGHTPTAAKRWVSCFQANAMAAPVAVHGNRRGLTEQRCGSSGDL